MEYGELKKKCDEILAKYGELQIKRVEEVQQLGELCEIQITAEKLSEALTDEALEGLAPAYADRVQNLLLELRGQLKTYKS